MKGETREMMERVKRKWKRRERSEKGKEDGI